MLTCVLRLGRLGAFTQRGVGSPEHWASLHMDWTVKALLEVRVMGASSPFVLS